MDITTLVALSTSELEALAEAIRAILYDRAEGEPDDPAAPGEHNAQ